MLTAHVVPSTYENVVIRNPVSPKVAVNAGTRQLRRLIMMMIAKLSQKARPMLGPTMPVLSVATAILALNLVILSYCSRNTVSGG